MKKLFAILVLAAILCPVLAMSASAAVEATAFDKPVDVTETMKYYTVRDMYKGKLPVIRADAQFMPYYDYDSNLIGKAPSTGVRTIIFPDWKEAGYTPYFNDEFYNGEASDGSASFTYGMSWANATTVGAGDDRAQQVFKFTTTEAGTYEFVFVGAAQITVANVGLPERNRGFAYSVDNGAISQVNISKTKGIFREYSYSYTDAEATAKEEPIDGGVNSFYYQVAYFYNLTAELTAGEHTLEFYHLFYSGDVASPSGNSRLNYAGCYVQKYIPEIEWANYVYPETTAPITTEAPVTTEAPATTAKVTAAPVTTAAPVGTTAAPSDTTAPPAKAAEKGCGKSAAFYAFVQIALIGSAAIIFIKKR